MAAYIIVSVIAYLMGSISFAVIFGKLIGGIDVRTEGSKNAGSTNVLRTVGKRAAICSLICDVLKGVFAVLIAIAFGALFQDADKHILVQLAALFVVIGHTFPVFFKFKGGKGVATSLGVLLIINWKIGLICLVYALTLMVITKMVSLGSIAAAILFPILVAFIGDCYIVEQSFAFQYFVFAVLLGLMVVYNHRTNIKRLHNGTENRISFSKKKPEVVEESEEEVAEEVEVKETKKSKKKSK